LGEAYGVAKARMRGTRDEKRKHPLNLILLYRASTPQSGEDENPSHSEECGYNFDPLEMFFFLPGYSHFLIS
jgi:hypothetical protein